MDAWLNNKDEDRGLKAEGLRLGKNKKNEDGGRRTDDGRSKKAKKIATGINILSL